MIRIKINPAPHNIKPNFSIATAHSIMKKKKKKIITPFNNHTCARHSRAHTRNKKLHARSESLQISAQRSSFARAVKGYPSTQPLPLFYTTPRRFPSPPRSALYWQEEPPFLYLSRQQESQLDINKKKKRGPSREDWSTGRESRYSAPFEAAAARCTRHIILWPRITRGARDASSEKQVRERERERTAT